MPVPSADLLRLSSCWSHTSSVSPAEPPSPAQPERPSPSPSRQKPSPEGTAVCSSVLPLQKHQSRSEPLSVPHPDLFQLWSGRTYPCRLSTAAKTAAKTAALAALAAPPSPAASSPAQLSPSPPSPAQPSSHPLHVCRQPATGLWRS